MSVTLDISSQKTSPCPSEDEGSSDREELEARLYSRIHHESSLTGSFMSNSTGVNDQNGTSHLTDDLLIDDDNTGFINDILSSTPSNCVDEENKIVVGGKRKIGQLSVRSDIFSVSMSTSPTPNFVPDSSDSGGEDVDEADRQYTDAFDNLASRSHLKSPTTAPPPSKKMNITLHTFQDDNNSNFTTPNWISEARRVSMDMQNLPHTSLHKKMFYGAYTSKWTPEMISFYNDISLKNLHQTSRDIVKELANSTNIAHWKVNNKVSRLSAARYAIQSQTRVVRKNHRSSSKNDTANNFGGGESSRVTCYVCCEKGHAGSKCPTIGKSCIQCGSTENVRKFCWPLCIRCFRSTCTECRSCRTPGHHKSRCTKSWTKFRYITQPPPTVTVTRKNEKSTSSTSQNHMSESKCQGSVVIAESKKGSAEVRSRAAPSEVSCASPSPRDISSWDELTQGSKFAKYVFTTATKTSGFPGKKRGGTEPPRVERAMMNQPIEFKSLSHAIHVVTDTFNSNKDIMSKEVLNKHKGLVKHLKSLHEPTKKFRKTFPKKLSKQINECLFGVSDDR